MPSPRSRIDRVPKATDTRAALEERRKRSVEEPLDVRLRQAAPYPILAVRNPLHGTEYLVMLPTYPSTEIALCTCTDFARRGLGRCKHIEAAIRWISGSASKRPPRAPPVRSVRPPALWKRIDRAVAELGLSSAPRSLAWRKPGRHLFENSVD
ncbi:MAG TPA: hypothetical protein VEK13_03055 [Thermoplasmata archaeon]|nr:hypothetical protein [Thermoplasmata archaeon]